MLREKWEPWPEFVRDDPVPFRARASADEIVVTFIGHSTFLIQTGDGNFITDPVYSRKAGPFGTLGPRRVRRPGVAIGDLPPISAILLSHNHYDHCDLAALRFLAERDQSTVITLLRNARLLKSAGASKVAELDWWDTHSFGDAMITAAPAQHFSARTPWDRNRALWGSFMLETRGKKIYYAADTGYAEHFREVRTRLGAPDLALLPIGAYEPRWFMKEMHMNPEESVQAHVDLGARQSIACHFGTYRLTAEAIDAPLSALHTAIGSQSVPVDFAALRPGESVTL